VGALGFLHNEGQLILLQFLEPIDLQLHLLLHFPLLIHAKLHLLFLPHQTGQLLRERGLPLDLGKSSVEERYFLLLFPALRVSYSIILEFMRNSLNCCF
jgi:hypothetical protein